MAVAVRLDLEATGGFEPPNRAFAELRLNHLATSPRRYIITFMVPRRRFELLRACAHCPLKTACLPIPPPRHENADRDPPHPFYPIDGLAHPTCSHAFTVGDKKAMMEVLASVLARLIGTVVMTLSSGSEVQLTGPWPWGRIKYNIYD